ncbi:MFS transporter [Paraburkholderia sp. Ac-20340]|uniref:MFS transporter n=1 Tax=Paraburkholderia sp. Ac-20340 TaxID=2703888 RepID=UPI00197EF4D5|nr:MFS transporter [Paraburkholderia sp. Ac-20340]MBN3856402.1 MFS transporter [Paraburkholderia sp. Ac-20340]
MSASSRLLRPSGAFVLLATACLTIMVGSAIVPGLPVVAHQLGLKGLESWLVTMPSVGVVVLGPVAGRLVDKVGLRPGLLLGLFLYGAFGVAAPLLHGPYVVLIDRFLLGGATALVMATGTGLISTFYDGQQRLAMIARQGMAIELGGVIFLTIGGWLASRGWWYPFSQYALAWVLLALALRYIPVQPKQAGPTLEQDAAGMPRELLRVYCAAFFSMGCFFVGVIVLPLRFHEIGIGEALTGYFLAFVSLVAVGFAALMPRLASRAGSNTTLFVAFISYAVAHAIFSVSDALPAFFCGAVALGAGFGLSVPLVNHLTVEISSENRRGSALAALSMAIFAGQCIPSFMQYSPGNTAALFRAAAAMGLVVALGLPLLNQFRRT